jgi:hypothetical protein
MGLRTALGSKTKADDCISYPQDRDEVMELRGAVSFPYRPTHRFDGPFVDDRQRSIFNLPKNGVIIKHDVPGWLRPEDAAKLHELAVFAKGPAFELGTASGLSATIISEARGDAEPFDTVDLNSTDGPRRRLAARGLRNIRFHQSDAAAWLEAQANLVPQYGFAFVDHSHSREHVRAACQRLDRVMASGAFVAFHDYSDPRNFDGTDGYGVFQGVEEGLSYRFRFYGCFGCMGVYRLM